MSSFGILKEERRSSFPTPLLVRLLAGCGDNGGALKTCYAATRCNLSHIALLVFFENRPSVAEEVAADAVVQVGSNEHGRRACVSYLGEAARKIVNRDDLSNTKARGEGVESRADGHARHIEIRREERTEVGLVNKEPSVPAVVTDFKSRRNERLVKVGNLSGGG